MTKKHPLTLLFLLLNLTALWASEAEQLFNEGNEAYLDRDYPRATELYQKSLSEEQTAATQFNLGNAYYKQGKTGYAILHYERALILDPTNPEAQANLNWLRKELHLETEELGLFKRYAHLLNINTWAWIAVACFWMAVTFILLPRLQGMRRPLCNGLAFLCILGFIASKAALYHYHLEAQQGVVLTQNAPLKIAPTESSNALLHLHEGELLNIEGDTFESFIRVETPKGQSGWIKKDDFSKIWES